MTTGTATYDERLLDAIRELLGEIETLSADFGATVREAVAAARSHSVDPANAERLYTRVLRILRGELDGVESEAEIAD